MKDDYIVIYAVVPKYLNALFIYVKRRGIVG